MTAALAAAPALADARALIAASEVVDLHVDTFIWTRIFGYDFARRHGRGPFGGRLLGQVDLPRLREAGVGSAIWSITTNPLRGRAGRARAFFDNFVNLRSRLSRAEGVRVVTTAAEHRAARAEGRHAAFLGVQGGNALDADLTRIPPELVKVTLVHLSTSTLGATSAPLGGAGGLTPLGRETVAALDGKRIFVDLAHISRRGFFDAVQVHDRALPLLVSHTGVAGVRPHWRNVDAEQLRAVAATGGVVGVMYQSSFLGRGAVSAETVALHLEEIVRVAGEDTPALGSDWDGMIVPPPDLRTCLELPVLVRALLARGWSHARIQKVLGGNFLRALAALRG